MTTAPRFTLTLAEPHAAGATTWPIGDGSMTVGRAGNCDVSVQHPSVSRVHAAFTVTGDACRLADLGSSNGTFVNGERITDAEVRAGDRIAFGEVPATLTALAPPAPVATHPLPLHGIPPLDLSGGPSAGPSADAALLDQPGTMFWRVGEEEAPAAAVRVREPERLIALLSEAARALMLHGSLPEILGRVVDLAVEHLSAERAVLMLMDEKGAVIVQVQRPLPAGHDVVTPPTTSRAVVLAAPPNAWDERRETTSPVTSSVTAPVGSSIGSSSGSPIGSSIGSPIGAPIASSIGLPIGSALGPPPISQTVARRVMQERVAFLAEDVRHHSLIGQAESVIARRVQSLMCAPLWHEDRVSGVLYVEDGLLHKFNAADLEILVSLSNYAAVAIERSQLADRLLAETQRRERLERYHSPAVVDRILGAAQRPGPEDAEASAQERQVTVLFADLVGFTSIAETAPASEVARLLNEFFADMTDAIFDQDGTLDKFIGDGLLAVFGAPLAQPDHASRAVAAAIDMQRRLRARNARGADTPLLMRIGVHTGPVVAGDFGSPKRREYTVLGDTVNMASRLESSVAQPGQIVLTRVTLDQLRTPVPTESLGLVPLRGRRQAVEVFAVTE